MNKKAAIFIDGSNLYYKLKSESINAKNLLNFDYAGLVTFLAGKRNVKSKGYYIGVVRAKLGNKKGQRMRTEQRKLFNILINQGFSIKKGYLMKTGTKYHEKGVDVQLAVDILVGAYENLYDSAIILSSDTDLIPAIIKAKSLGKRIEYVGFGSQPSYGLIKHATESRLLVKADIEPFVR